ncbi:hypothetical protein NEOLEDRAFT_559983 [Neolentinus lepideus HHB14362 ss-1]|uniref:F-box domain-containing protein n=1 Tax=Neolentinus lepideus HHB14362 ss-1 TaxID=1314782 RepID=A0A165R6L2_9AGAM|nr:hypothetical protein NEOLEDRAFT_559983 [Neolentinus lepideus HHB14362 ss-1]
MPSYNSPELIHAPLAPTMLTDLPPELLEKIALLASLDGSGRTAASLRLVSRYVSAVAEPYTFYCISVHGPQMMSRLCNDIGNASFKARNNCRHLLMSDVAEDVLRKLEARNTPVDSSLDIFYSPGHGASDLMLALLKVVAPTLETFTLLIYDGSTLVYERILSVKYPLLRNFHIHLRSLALIRRLDRKLHLPALHSLHVSFAFVADRHNMDMAINFLTTIRAENLASAQLSGVRNSSISVDGLRSTVGESYHAYAGLADPGPLAPSVQQLLVQAIMSPTILFGNPLKYLTNELSTRSDQRFVVLPETMGMTYETCRDEWTKSLGAFGDST